jgi:hypothetical protein
MLTWCWSITALYAINLTRCDLAEIDKINESPEPNELPSANEDSAQYRAGFRRAKRVNRATVKLWIGIAGGLTHRNRYTRICGGTAISAVQS